MNGGSNPILPLHQIVDIGTDLIRFPVEVLQLHIHNPTRPTLARYLAVQLRKVALFDRFTPINITLYSA